MPDDADVLAALLVPLLTNEEAVRTLVYDDATGKLIGPGRMVVGHPTIGIGRALDRKGITRAEAHYLLVNDIAEVQRDLDKCLPWWRQLDPRRQMVLAAMAFQMGVDGLLKFTNTLSYAKAGSYERAAKGMLDSLWARQTPARAQRMAEIMRKG